MKNIKSFAIVAMLCITNLCQAETPVVVLPPPEVIIPVPMPDQVPIGEIAVVEALAASNYINLSCGTASSPDLFVTKVRLGVVKSIDDIKKVIQTIYIDFSINDPKESINLAVDINDAMGKNLFKSKTSFTLEKVYDRILKKFVYQTPYYAGNIWFQLADTEVHVPGATTAYMLHRNGDIYQLNVLPGSIIQIPGWMNQAGYFSELVVNDNLRYDVNGGLRLQPKNCKLKIMNVAFNQIQKVEYSSVLTTITVYPQFGSIPNSEITVTDNHLKLQVKAGEYYWVYPIAIYIATLEDLKPGGKGWTVHPYSSGMDLKIPSGTYYVYPEYQDKVLGSGIVVGGGQG